MDEFIERFKTQNYQKLQGKVEDKEKAMLLANALPVEVLTDIQRRLKPVTLSNATYSEIETHLISLFSSKKSIIGASVTFLNRKQLPEETIEQFANALNELASHCAYGNCCRDRLLRDAFVSGLRNARIISAIIQDCEAKKFHEVLERAKIIEQLNQDIAEFNPNSKFLNTNHVKSSAYQNKNNKKSQDAVKSKFNKISDRYICCRCGVKGKHLSSDCYALKITCTKTK